MQTSIRKPQFEPHKRMNKASKLALAKSVFICECSRTYLSFPALYLHAKNKHDTLFTSRVEEENCIVEEKKGKFYYTFFYSQSCPENKTEPALKFPSVFQNYQFAIKVGNENQEFSRYSEGKEVQSFETQKEPDAEKFDTQIEDVKDLVEAYLRSPRVVHSHQIRTVKSVLKKFIEYIEQMLQVSKQQFSRILNSQPNALVQSLPLLFNEFAFYYLPENFWSGDYNGINKRGQIQVMKMFANWLKEHQFTSYVVLYND